MRMMGKNEEGAEEGERESGNDTFLRVCEFELGLFWTLLTLVARHPLASFIAERI